MFSRALRTRCCAAERPLIGNWKIAIPTRVPFTVIGTRTGRPSGADELDPRCMAPIIVAMLSA